MFIHVTEDVPRVADQFERLRHGDDESLNESRQMRNLLKQEDAHRYERWVNLREEQAPKPSSEKTHFQRKLGPHEEQPLVVRGL